MKTCPFCRESVHADATKCRYCQSSLLATPAPSASEEGPGGRVTYVLDRDLIRFGKFVGAVLAVFLVVGAYLFGFRLESALDEVKSTQKELEGMRTQLLAAKDELTKAQGTVNTLRNEVEQTLAQARTIVGDINLQRSQAIDLVLSIRDLTPAQRATLEKAKQEDPDKFQVATGGRYWKRGLTLRVRFLSGNESSRQVAREAAAEWAKYANLNFSFVDTGDAEIRVSMKDSDGSWSFLGTEALGIPTSDPTMNLTPGDRVSALHEFGHAIGLIEEHQNPYGSPPQWKRDVVLREVEKMFGWDRETTERQILRREDSNVLGPYRPFDPLSIMCNQIYPASWTGGATFGGARELSESDKALVRRLYPGRPAAS